MKTTFTITLTNGETVTQDMTLPVSDKRQFMTAVTQVMAQIGLGGLTKVDHELTHMKHYMPNEIVAIDVDVPEVYPAAPPMPQAPSNLQVIG